MCATVNPRQDVQAILHGIQHGFNRNRPAPGEGDDDGTDAEARRRRAALFADQVSVRVV